MAIRNAAKAIIINDGKILVNKNRNTLGEMCYGLPVGAIYYDMPGGGQNQYEMLEEAVKRECMEESGYTVEVERLAAVYEEISTNADFRKKYEEYAHKIHFVFICKLMDVPKRAVTVADLDMVCSEWVSIDDLKSIPLYPLVIADNITNLLLSNTTTYLGSQFV